jgi:hypothetical protein
MTTANRIVENIVASQRPSSRIILEYGLIEKFSDLGIWSIVNLEEFGEHVSCGDGIDETSGFAYIPEELMAAGSKTTRIFFVLDNGRIWLTTSLPKVYYYNFGW